MRAESGSAKRTLKVRTNRPEGNSNRPIRPAPSELYAFVPSGEIAALSPMANAAVLPGSANSPTRTPRVRFQISMRFDARLSVYFSTDNSPTVPSKSDTHWLTDSSSDRPRGQD